MKTRMPAESKPSLLLTRDENELVFRLVGSRCQSLATAVVQLFQTEGPAHNQWFKRDTGILCLIKDNQRKSYFFRIYCMQRRSMIWEHEVYTQIEYKNPRPFLHTFEAEDCMTAFNFASEEEASLMRNSLIEKLELRRQKLEKKQQNAARMSGDLSRHASVIGKVPHAPPAVPNHQQNITPNPPFAAPVTITNTHYHNGTSAPPPIAKGFGSNYISKSGPKKPKARKLTKADISMPTDFKHVSHVGWDANKGFDIDNLPEKDMKDFFLKAGVSESQLKDKDTREFIYDFIKNHGGVNAIKNDLVQQEDVKSYNINNNNNSQVGRAAMPPPVPARNPNMPNTPPISIVAPPVRDTSSSRNPPPPPARAPPPPPPPPIRQIPPPTTGSMAAPPPPPPPPPPPTPPSAPPIAPAPPTAPTADPHAALMESIRGRKTLKPVEIERRPSEDKRGDLLDEIRQGIELRPVNINANENDRKPMQETVGLAGALARALEERSKAMHSDSSDSDDGDTVSDGDEWD